MAGLIHNQIEFFRQYRTHFTTTGAVAPSSRFLAASMTRPMTQRDRSVPIRMLEIGPGTGAVTNRIVRELETHDRFDLVELNDRFVELLTARFASDPAWKAVADQSHIHKAPVQDYIVEHPYDFIISGLPLNNFPAELVEDICATYMRLLKPGGVLSYFEYMYIRPIRKVISRGKSRVRIRAIDERLAEFTDAYRFKRDWVFPNVPPAWVQHLRKSES